MTTDVSIQSTFIPLMPSKLAVTQQASFIAIFPGTRVNVTEQSAYVVMFDMNPPVAKRRRVINILSN